MSIRLFVADTDEGHIQRVAQGVAGCPDICFAGSGGNGAHVLRQLSVSPVDVLITEVQLPGLDGIMLLKELRALRSRPAAIVCTGFYSQACVAKARSCGATYYMYKPVDYSRLPEVIRECHRARLEAAANAPAPIPAAKQRNQAAVIRALLTEMGMPSRLTGSMYLSEALLAAGDDPSLLKNLSKGLYVEVAARMRSTPSRLERALRNAIRVACERGGLDRRFGHRPSNREFLVYMLDQFRLRCPR